MWHYYRGGVWNPLYAPKKRIITSSVLPLTTGPHQRVIHWCLFLEALGAAARSTLVQHSLHVPPVNNSYAVGLQRRVREQAATYSEPTGRQGNTQGAPPGRAMHPKTMRQQNTQHNGSEQATPMRWGDLFLMLSWWHFGWTFLDEITKH